MRYDAELAALRGGVEQVVVELVVGPRSSPTSRKAILPHMDDLAAFLGRRQVSLSVDPHTEMPCLACKSYILDDKHNTAVSAGAVDSTMGNSSWNSMSDSVYLWWLPAHTMHICKLCNRLTRASLYKLQARHQ